MTLRTDDLRIIETQELSTPEEVRRELPVSDTSAKMIMDSRKIVENILDEKDDRIFVVIGPCSIHDPIAAMDYAKRLKKISSELSKNLFIIMRVYFEKPRTTIGWKGLINDPMLDGSFKINDGIRIGRKLLLDIVNLNIPTGTEYLDLISIFFNEKHLFHTDKKQKSCPDCTDDKQFIENKPDKFYSRGPPQI